MGFTFSAIGSGLGYLVGRYLTKTSLIANNYFDDYLGKTFTAGIRSSSGKSSSALLRQTSSFLCQSVFWDNVTQGVSSVVGSFVSTAITTIRGIFERYGNRK